MPLVVRRHGEQTQPLAIGGGRERAIEHPEEQARGWIGVSTRARAQREAVDDLPHLLPRLEVQRNELAARGNRRVADEPREETLPGRIQLRADAALAANADHPIPIASGEI